MKEVYKKKKPPEKVALFDFGEWALTDSNRRPSACKAEKSGT